MEFKDISQSKTVRGILIGILCAIAILLIFQAGVLVGVRKAEFSYGIGENYYRNLGGPKGPMGNFPRDAVDSGHGASGKIVSISLPNLVIADDAGIEKTVIVENDTLIRRFHDSITGADIKVDDFAVVLGSPNEKGEVMAKLIRILPPPTPAATTTSIK